MSFSRCSIPGRISRTLLVLLAAALCQTAVAQPAAPAPPAVPVVQINVNEADAAALADALQGVGPARARAIVEYREQNGPFESIDELSEVNGIGDATLNLNRDRIVLE